MIPQVVSIVRIVARPIASFLTGYISIDYADKLIRDAFGIEPTEEQILQETVENPNASIEQIRATFYLGWLFKAVGLSYLLYKLYCMISGKK